MLCAILGFGLVVTSCTQQAQMSSSDEMSLHENNCSEKYEQAYLERKKLTDCFFRFDELDFTQAAQGEIGPYMRQVTAVPYLGGGSGGAFTLAIFQKRDRLRWVAAIPFDYGGISNPVIRNRRIIIHGNMFPDKETHATPHARMTYIVASQKNGFVIEKKWWNRIAHGADIVKDGQGDSR